MLYIAVANGSVVQPYPSDFSSSPIMSQLTSAELLAKGWYQFIDSGQPTYNAIAQTISSSFVVNSTNGTVTKNYTVSDISLAAWQTAQIQILFTSYQAAIATPVSFTTAAGLTKTFQADPGSVANLQASIAGCQKAAATPAGFYWVAADNTQVPMTYADLLGLAEVIFNQGASAFQKLQTLKAQVNAATTIPAVQAIVW